MTRPALALAALLAIAQFVAAQDPPAPPPPATPKPAGGIDLDGLAKLLDATTLKTKLDGKHIKVYLPGDEEWQVQVWTNETTPSMAYLTFHCQQIPAGPPPGEPLLKLLGQNGFMNGAYFGYNEKTRVVFLELVVPAEGLTTKKLRADLDRVQKLALKTVDLWAVGKWPGAEKK